MTGQASIDSAASTEVFASLEEAEFGVSDVEAQDATQSAARPVTAWAILMRTGQTWLALPLISNPRCLKWLKT